MDTQRPVFKRNDKVLEMMGAIQVVIDGEPLQDAANALQYVLNMIHTLQTDGVQQNGPRAL